MNKEAVDRDSLEAIFFLVMEAVPVTGEVAVIPVISGRWSS